MDLLEVELEENMETNVTPSERSANFTMTEIEKFKKLINKYSKIILNKKTNGLSIKQKEETWEVIAKEFNASNSIYRSVKQLKCKWEYIKKSSRKEAGIVNRMRRQTGGGPPPPPLSETTEWVSGILKESVSGINSQYDGDVIVEPPPATSIYATVNMVDTEMIDVAKIQNIQEVKIKNCIEIHGEEPTIPVSAAKRPVRKLLNATPHQTRESFLELANMKKDLVQRKIKSKESNEESALVKIKVEKCRLELELMKKAFENDEQRKQNDERRKQELHELQVLKLKSELKL